MSCSSQQSDVPAAHYALGQILRGRRVPAHERNRPEWKLTHARLRACSAGQRPRGNGRLVPAAAARLHRIASVVRPAARPEHAAPVTFVQSTAHPQPAAPAIVVRHASGLSAPPSNQTDLQTTAFPHHNYCDQTHTKANSCTLQRPSNHALSPSSFHLSDLRDFVSSNHPFSSSDTRHLTPPSTTYQLLHRQNLYNISSILHSSSLPE